MRTSEIGRAAGMFLRPCIQLKTGGPFETPSLFKSVLRTFLNRLSYVQFVSGGPTYASGTSADKSSRIHRTTYDTSSVSCSNKETPYAWVRLAIAYTHPGHRNHRKEAYPGKARHHKPKKPFSQPLHRRISRTERGREGRDDGPFC